jgi:hypothetical protein
LRDFDDLSNEDKGIILAQSLEASKELRGNIGMIHVALKHPETAKEVLKRIRSSVVHRTKRTARRVVTRSKHAQRI